MNGDADGVDIGIDTGHQYARGRNGDFVASVAGATVGIVGGRAISTSRWKNQKDVVIWATLQAAFFQGLADKLSAFSQKVEAGEADYVWNED